MFEFTEEYECKADSKGRIMVPAALRATVDLIAENCETGVVSRRIPIRG